MTLKFLKQFYSIWEKASMIPYFSVISFILFPLKVRGHSASAAAEAGHHPGPVGHGEGAPHDVLQEHGRLQAPPHHHVQGRGQRGSVHTRAPTRAHCPQGGMHQGENCL